MTKKKSLKQKLLISDPCRRNDRCEIHQGNIIQLSDQHAKEDWTD